MFLFFPGDVTNPYASSLGESDNSDDDGTNGKLWRCMFVCVPPLPWTPPLDPL